MSNFRARISKFVNSSAAQCIKSIERGSKGWIASTRQAPNTYYHQYVEAMLAEVKVLRQQWQNEKCSDFTILLRLLPHAFDLGGGIIRLLLGRYIGALSTLFYGVELLIYLSRSVDTVAAANSIPEAPIFAAQGLGSVAKSVGGYPYPVKLHLDTKGRVIAWDQNAVALFGFDASEIVGKEAIETFVPSIETGGRTLANLILEICTYPQYYRLNLNENQDRQGNRLWMLWINAPKYNLEHELTEVVSLGLQTQDPDFLKPFVHLCQSLSHSRSGFCPMSH